MNIMYEILVYLGLFINIALALEIIINKFKVYFLHRYYEKAPMVNIYILKSSYKDLLDSNLCTAPKFLPINKMACLNLN